MNRNNKALCVMLALAVALQLSLFTLVAYWLGTIAGLVAFTLLTVIGFGYAAGAIVLLRHYRNELLSIRRRNDYVRLDPNTTVINGDRR